MFLLDGFSANLFSASLPGQCLLDPFLFARFQVERVFLDFLDDVFLLNLAFEPPQGVFNGFSVLNPYFSQSVHPHSMWAFNRQTSDYSAVSTFPNAILPPLWRVVRCVLRGAGKRYCPGKNRPDLCGLLRYQARSGDRLPVFLPPPDRRPFL